VPAVAPRVISYAQLVSQIERAANVFRDASGGAPASVALILPMLPEALIATWAAATAGTACPINPFLELKQVTALMNAVQATVLVTTDPAQHGPGAWDQLEALRAAVPTLQRVLIVDGGEHLPPGCDDFAALLAAQPGGGLRFTPTADGQTEAVYLPTGGTTAAPKLVRMTHWGQLLNAWMTGAVAGSERDCVVGHAMPNFHVGGLVMLGLRAIIYGQTLLTLTTAGFRNPEVVRHFWDIVRHHKMTSVIATPPTASAILAVPGQSSAGHSLRVFNAGGSTVPMDLARSFHQRFGLWISEVWGMSEMHGFVTAHPDILPPTIGSVGRRMAYHDVQVVEVDANNRYLRTCAPGERGVLAITGPGLTLGYLDDSLSAEFFMQGTPDGRRWANTGDLGLVDADGLVYVSGRSKDVIIRGGHNIDPRMIEEALMSHPEVQMAAAVGRPDAGKGEMPIVFVQLKAGASATPQDLLQHCRPLIPERAAVPVEVHLIDSMPMTAVGKLAKPKLREIILRRVACDVAAASLGEAATVQVALDDTGRRTTVVLRLYAPGAETPQRMALAERLRTAFQGYEFATRVEFAG
jgi:fatty-acyl-CoA synthase